MAITKRVRRYPLPGESAFHTYTDEGAGGGGLPGGAGEAERGCGFREDGGTYAVVPTRTDGRGLPVEFFTVCQPLRIDADEYGLSNIGVKLIDLPETCHNCGGTGKIGGAAVPWVKGAKYVEDCPACGALGVIPVTHVFDIIGGEAYPNVADFLEEARRLGISRRLELGDAKEYARLTSKSRLFLLHKRAIIENPQDYWAAMSPEELTALVEAGGCTKGLPDHLVNLSRAMGGGRFFDAPVTPPGCAALWWHDLAPDTAEAVFGDCEKCAGAGFTMEANEFYGRTSEMYAQPVTCPHCDAGRVPYVSERFSRRQMPSFDYGGFTRAEEITPLYSLGVFGIFPLARIEVVDSSGGDEYNAAFDRASAAKLPVELTDC